MRAPQPSSASFSPEQAQPLGLLAHGGSVRQLDATRWEVNNGSDRGVETSETIRFPDVIVEPSGADDESLATSEPAIVVEVLSPTSGERDTEIKPAEYMGLPSLLAYIVASQGEPACLVWLRAPDGSFYGALIDGRPGTNRVQRAHDRWHVDFRRPAEAHPSCTLARDWSAIQARLGSSFDT